MKGSTGPQPLRLVRNQGRTAGGRALKQLLSTLVPEIADQAWDFARRTRVAYEISLDLRAFLCLQEAELLCRLHAFRRGSNSEALPHTGAGGDARGAIRFFANLTRAVTGMCESLGITATAEGV